jgi:hypothetical protein
MTGPDGIEISKAELHAMLTKAAAEGARQALHSVGLHDDRAGDDIRDLRALLTDWRSVRQTVLTTTARIITAAILGAIAGAAALTAWKRGHG